MAGGSGPKRGSSGWRGGLKGVSNGIGVGGESARQVKEWGLSVGAVGAASCRLRVI